MSNKYRIVTQYPDKYAIEVWKNAYMGWASTEPTGWYPYSLASHPYKNDIIFIFDTEKKARSMLADIEREELAKLRRAQEALIENERRLNFVPIVIEEIEIKC